MEGKLLKELTEEGYYHSKEIEGKGLCGIRSFMYTTGIVYNIQINEYCYEGRYCYENAADALKAFNEWDGKYHPTGPWIKHKSKYYDQHNPNSCKHILKPQGTNQCPECLSIFTS